MPELDELKAMLAVMLTLPADQISAETSLASLDSSLGGAKLKLGLKRLGISLPTTCSPQTFGELEAALSGNPLAKDPPRPFGTVTERAVPAPPGFSIGIDTQEVRALPVATDYWVHEFYLGTFSKSEIAYSVVQSEPRVHFAARWCAKEALRKCDPSLMHVPFDATAVAHEPDGRPYLVHNTRSGIVRLPYALSMSHTDAIATAVVMMAPPPQENKATSGLAPEPEQDRQAPPQNGRVSPSRRLGGGPLFFLAAGAAIALAARHFWPF